MTKKTHVRQIPWLPPSAAEALMEEHIPTFGAMKKRVLGEIIAIASNGIRREIRRELADPQYSDRFPPTLVERMIAAGIADQQTLEARISNQQRNDFVSTFISRQVEALRQRLEEAAPRSTDARRRADHRPSFNATA